VIVLPAVDIKGGRCVQLVGGKAANEKVSLANPPDVALRWWDMGFKALHVVDLDSAMGSGNNDNLTGEVIAASPADTQVGGGVRSDERAAELFMIGANRIVVGTRAVDDRPWLEKLVAANPGRVVVAADVNEGKVLKKGWTEASALRIEPFLASLADLQLAGVLITDVAREGRMEGIDIEGVRALLDASPHPVQVSGGITSLEDLGALAEAGAAGAVLGMALYTGRLDAETVARTYGG
jgi:phosphoribosylformimino-5-aminoimidazole carboxamide ribotide isomerase